MIVAQLENSCGWGQQPDQFFQAPKCPPLVRGKVAGWRRVLTAECLLLWLACCEGCAPALEQRSGQRCRKALLERGFSIELC